MMTVLLVAALAALVMVAVSAVRAVRAEREAERASAEAWRMEQESITPEEREAADEMLMSTIARSANAWMLYRLDPAARRHAQSKAYAVAAVRWKKMRRKLEEMRSWRQPEVRS